MLPTSRRIFLYWLLLLVPALVVGGAAILLLRREEARLAQRGAEVGEARRAALATQARLIVENIELFSGDVQTGLLDVLAAEPAAGLDAFLDRWEKTNPLVRIAFRCLPDGGLLRPSSRPADEEAQGFVRRFAREFAQRPPWGAVQRAAASKAIERDEKRQQESSEVRRTAAQNVVQAQSARRDLQQLALNRETILADSTPSTSSSSAPGFGLRSSNSRAEGKFEMAPSVSAPAVAKVGLAAPELAAKDSAVKESAAEVRGWLPQVIDGRLHVIGWVQPGAQGEVRGVELQLAALVSRLG